MGLFSFFSKNKQTNSAFENGLGVREDAALGVTARAKRASNAGGAAVRRGKDGRADADPILPEKKRARRRLVGAIALALAVAVALPMVLDAEQKPLAADIAFQIPSKDKVAPLPTPTASASAAAASGAPSATAGMALDQHEEVVADQVQPDVTDKTPAKAEPKSAVAEKPPVETHVKLPVADKAMVKAQLQPMLDANVAVRMNTKPAEPKPTEPKPSPKPVEVMPSPKPADAKDDAARARAILEDKPAEHIAGRFVVQVAALATQGKIDELQVRLKGAGIASYTQKIPVAGGELTRVKVGPFSNREEADKVRAKLAKLGLPNAKVQD